MRFERLGDDKIQVNVSSDDLEKNNIDSTLIMKNAKVNQSLFLLILDTAEKDFGFKTENYTFEAETIADKNGDFVITITRKMKTAAKLVSKPAVKIPSSYNIFKFYDIEEYLNFVEHSIENKIYNKNICENTQLFEYDNNYYLLLEQINNSSKTYNNFHLALTEFSKQVADSTLLKNKLSEFGNVIFKDKAIENTKKYFIS